MRTNLLKPAAPRYTTPTQWFCENPDCRLHVQVSVDRFTLKTQNPNGSKTEVRRLWTLNDGARAVSYCENHVPGAKS